jgi:hypothetical protein
MKRLDISILDFSKPEITLKQNLNFSNSDFVTDEIEYWLHEFVLSWMMFTNLSETQPKDNSKLGTLIFMGRNIFENMKNFFQDFPFKQFRADLDSNFNIRMDLITKDNRAITKIVPTYLLIG